MERVTPEMITDLKANEVFVFGSNAAGNHYGGAAHTALQWGAEWKVGEGLRGQTYAFPTLTHWMQPMPKVILKEHVQSLRRCIARNPQFIFLITEVGCGIAGFRVEQMAPLFEPLADMPNVYLPARFWAVLNQPQRLNTR